MGKGIDDAFITRIGPDADISITKGESRDPVMVGNNLTYTLTVRNAGPDEAANVSVTDSLPAGVIFVSTTPSQGSCAGTNLITCNLGNLSRDAMVTVSVVVTPSSVRTLTNTANVSSNTADHDTSNNTSTQQTRVSPLPSIAGHVATSGGVGVGAVNIGLSGSQIANKATATDGFYEFPDLTAGGNYTITPSRTGFVFHPQSLNFNNLTSDGTADFNAVACIFQITPTNQSFPSAGGSGSVTITGNDGLCPWTATSDVPWITVTSGAFGTSAGTVTFSVEPTNSSRSGTLRIGGNVFTVWQELSPCSTVTFSSTPRFPATQSPAFLSSGDFNNDGMLDVVVLNDTTFSSAAQTISIMLGTAGGGFSAPSSVSLGGQPGGITVGDFNNDGKLDAAALVFGQSNNVKILLGDGAGHLNTPATFTAGGLPSSIAVGNFNGDANADLAVSNQDSHNVSILLGTGLGTFGAPTQIGGSGSVILHAAKRVVIADFNRDSKQDLVVQGTFMWLLLGHGDGTFDTPVQLNNNVPLGAVVVGDFNNDNKADLAGTTINFGPILTVILGDGAGGFGAPIDSSSGRRDPAKFVVADFNSDGKPDLGSINTTFQSTGDVSIFLGDGTGAFTLGPAYVVGAQPRDLIVGDLNGDSKTDLAVGDATVSVGTGSVVVLAGNGNGSFVGPRSFVAPFLTGEIAADDFNSDGKLDLMAFTQFGIFLVPGTIAGEFGSPVLAVNATAFTSDFGKRSFSTSDFNHDGKPDLGILVLDGSQSRAKVFLNNGVGTFTPVSDTLLENFNNFAHFADFNGDGNPDLISVVNIGRLALRLGNGAGSFNAPVLISPQIDNLTRLESGDFNGDGKTDLAVGTSNPNGCGSPNASALQVMFGDGAGGFTSPSNTSFTGFVTAMVSQDLNGDGRSDLVVANGCTQKGVVLFANATGNFTASSEFTIGDDTLRLVLADVSGDGKPDLITSHGNSNNVDNIVSVLTGDGAGGFSAPMPISSEVTGASIAVADFDRNGHYDVGVAGFGSGHIGIFLNTCPVVPAPSTIQFAASTFSAGEGAFFADITVTRTGDTANATSVEYATSNGSASERSDYTAAVGTLLFAPGETSKSFMVLLTDDALVEGTESILLTLSNPSGSPLGVPSSVVLNVVDNDAPGGPNPIDSNSQFFVRQHYHDFLNREPDASGLQFWVDQIESCGGDASCRELRRINVSAAFFLSIEFQETGYLAYRMFNAAYGDTTSPNVAGTVPIIRLSEFLPDSQRIGLGVQVGIGNWQQQLEDNKIAYALAFVQRQRFLLAFPLSMTASEFVAKLDQNTVGVLSPAEKSELEAILGTTPADAQKRASVVRKVAEDSDLKQRELNRAFVLTQYYGYLRRNPDDSPDTDFRGWKFWLGKLEQFNGNFVQAEMVKAFLDAGEYRHRFGL
jgi:uncharacterized repeat protein (TIGR01451 family)